jgi:methylated-DNA-[protein]-cysteine S-methyltransferase
MSDQTSIFRTTWGWMGLAASSRGIAEIVLPRPTKSAVQNALTAVNGTRGRSAVTSRNSEAAALLRRAQAQVVEFLAGRRRRLDIPVDLSRGTRFQRRVWRATLHIPYGQVCAYQWVAHRVGGRRYARAVGLALGGNPVPLVVPCHRVIASDGSLGGFTGGLRTKRRLLALEGALSRPVKTR